MKKIVIISSNNNPDYLFFAPYMEKAWNALGWEVAIMVTADVDPKLLNLNNPDTYICEVPDVPGLRKETLSQVGRLYAYMYLDPQALLMTSDMDLLPLSDYWHPDINEMTVYGHDLTWHSFYPMGYIAMKGEKWSKIMKDEGTVAAMIERDAKEIKLPYAADWEKWWNHDWTLITKRMKPYEKQIRFIDRGQIDIAGGTLAKGRIDRFNWEATQQQPGPFIDAHCENVNIKHPVKLEPFLKVFEKFYGKL